jgi:hypothetical protein
VGSGRRRSEGDELEGENNFGWGGGGGGGGGRIQWKMGQGEE